MNGPGGSNSNIAWVFDKLYGTRFHTPGAELQLPRKVPIRVEPKSFFANERTFLSWMSMAITLGGVSSVLLGFNGSVDDGKEQLISRRTVDIITVVYTPVSLIIMAYALFTYMWRSHFMHKKQIGFFDDHVGPIAVSGLVLLTLIAIFVVALIDFFQA